MFLSVCHHGADSCHMHTLRHCQSCLVRLCLARSLRAYRWEPERWTSQQISTSLLWRILASLLRSHACEFRFCVDGDFPYAFVAFQKATFGEHWRAFASSSSDFGGYPGNGHGSFSLGCFSSQRISMLPIFLYNYFVLYLFQ